MTFCPSADDIRSPTSRPMTSIGPPGGNGTIILIGLLGYDCAVAAPAATAAKPTARIPARKMRLAFIMPPSSLALVGRLPSREVYAQLRGSASAVLRRT
jgi:hypothetical protein